MNKILSNKLRGFSIGEVERMTRVSPRKLRWWGQIGLITPGASPTRRSRQRRRYTLQDIICLLVVKALRDNGVSLKKIKESMDRIGETGIDHPLAKFRVACLAHTVIIKKDGRYFEPISGQMVIEEALDLIRPHLERRRLAPTERAINMANLQYKEKIGNF